MTTEINEKMDELFMSLGTSILTYEATNSFESIVNDFTKLQDGEHDFSLFKLFDNNYSLDNHDNYNYNSSFKK